MGIPGKSPAEEAHVLINAARNVTAQAVSMNAFNSA